MIQKNDFVKTSKTGEKIISISDLKEVMIATKKLKSDGLHLYLLDEFPFWECLSTNVNIRLKETLFDEEAQALIKKAQFDSIVDDLIEDVRLIFDKSHLNNEQYVNFLNGVFDLEKKKLISREELPEQHFTYVINVEYIVNPDNVLPGMITVFKEFAENSFEVPFSDIKIKYFLENIGYALSSVNTLRKAWVLLGVPASGKSTIARFISELILPESAVSNVNFHDLGQRFRTHEIAIAKLNVGDEMTKSKLKNMSAFKSITSGMMTLVEQKGKNPQKIKPNVRQIYTANQLPDFNDGDINAILDRLNIVYFTKTISEENRNRCLLNNFLAEKEAIISLAVRAFASVYKNGVFSEPEDIKLLKKRYFEESNPILIFIKSQLVYEKNAKGLSSDKIYTAYLDFCDENDVIPESRQVLYSQIKKFFIHTIHKKMRIGEKNLRCFSGLKFKGV